MSTEAHAAPPVPDDTPPATLVEEPLTPGTSARLVGGRPFRRYLLWFGITMATITSVWGGVAGILLPNHVQLLEFGRFFTGVNAHVDLQKLNDLKAAVAAGTVNPSVSQTEQLALLKSYDASKAQSLAIVATVGALLTMILGPIVGVISDRTRSRFGRRAPFILFGGLAGAIALSCIQFAPSISVLVILWAVASLFFNTAQGPLNATVADRVIESRRGTASAVGGLGNFLGGVVGAVISGAAFAALGLGGYLLPALLVVIGVVGFTIFVKDRSSLALAIPTHRWGEFFKGFLVPLRSADYRWVWIARLVLTFGYTASTSFQLYMLQSYVQPAMSQVQATSFAPLLIAIGLPGTLVALVVAGRWSDRIGRRKPFVLFASLVMAATFLIPLVWPSSTALLVQAVLGGIAFGAYLSVDQALFIDVLPDRNSAGRDLGIAGLGSNLGQALAPILGAQVVVLTGGYQFIWVLALVLVAVGGFAILPVKAVR